MKKRIYWVILLFALAMAAAYYMHVPSREAQERKNDGDAGEIAVPADAQVPARPDFMECSAAGNMGQSPDADLIRTVQANLYEDEKFLRKRLIAASWGTLYLWRLNGFIGPKYDFIPYEPGAPLAIMESTAEGGMGEAALEGEAEGEGSECIAEEEYHPIYFSKIEPDAYILHTGLYFCFDCGAGSAVRWDLDQNKRLDLWHGETDYLKDLIISPDEQAVAVHYFWMGTPGEALSVFRNGDWFAEISALGTGIDVAAINHANTHVAVCTAVGIHVLVKLPPSPPEEDGETEGIEVPPPIFFGGDLPHNSLESTGNTELLRLKTKFEGSVSCAVFAPDDTVLALAGEDGWIQCFNGRGGGALASMKKLNSPVRELLFTADGSCLLARTESGKVQAYKTSTARPCYPALKHGTELAGMRLFADGTLLLTWGGTHLRAWGLSSGKEIYPAVKFTAPIAGAVFPREAPDTVVLWSRDGHFRGYDIHTGEPQIPLHQHGDSMAGVTLSKGCLLTWDEKGRIREWRVPLKSSGV
ncbi:MAG TPA: hypothetical protein PLI09_25185 [Candidatus Hydrogenedentes bacterium]|nr:hypothetical protein [Candidatus Hydrogenedentota bacterium]